MAKFCLALVALGFCGIAEAVSMTFTDACASTVTSGGVGLQAGPAGDLQLIGGSTPYTVLSCDPAATGAPQCSLSVSKAALSPGGSATLVATCSPTAASFTWISPAGWTPALSGAKPIVTFLNPGSYSFAVSGTNGAGTGPSSNAVTILVAAAGQAPNCSLSASPQTVHQNQNARLHAVCNPAPTTYRWASDGPTVPTSMQTTGSGEVTFPSGGTFSFDVQGELNGARGPAASATVTVIANETNWARGGVTYPSSQYGPNFPASSVIDGDRKGINNTAGGVWNDLDTTFPDSMHIDLSAVKTITHVTVYSVQDNWTNPQEPTDSMTFTQYGVNDFTISTYGQTGWVQQATVTGNWKVKRDVQFAAPVVTGAILITITKTPDARSRLVEVEAWGY